MVSLLTGAAGVASNVGGDSASGKPNESQTETAIVQNTENGLTSNPDLNAKLLELFGEGIDDSAPSRVREPIAAFKHKMVKLFQVGKFTFFDSILYIYDDEELYEFAELYKTLGGPDKTNIVAYNWQAAAAVESDASAAIRGMMTTRSIKDSKAIA